MGDVGLEKVIEESQDNHEMFSLIQQQNDEQNEQVKKDQEA